MRRALASFLSVTGSSFKLSLAVLMVASMALAAVGRAEANPKYAAIVVDANTGKTLFSSNADEPRYPASLTKMMTLYMVFEAMAAGKITKDSRIRFSKHAASRPPTKLGVGAGNSITVETAILSLVTKSANDAAAAVGEFLGGSEATFAKLMTAKARRLGMSSTTFRNASGLPDSGQKTTARDMAILGIALREHFPKQYHYFSTRSFTYGKQRMRNHNKLLGRVKGVDGIKTGYIRASGFNLVSSVSTGGRNIVAVVMGGRTGRSRDAHMVELIREYLPKASKRSSGPLLAARVLETENVIAARASAFALPKRNAPVPDERPEESVTLAYAAPEDKIAELAEAVAPQGDVDPVSTASTAREGWVIQVGSLPSETDARSFLARTAEKAPQLLADASAYTEVFTKGGTTYYRARFSGFASKSAAWDACGALKRKDIACYAVEQ